MKTDKEWEARALELARPANVYSAVHFEPWMSVTAALALALGREMADERAEEIARMCEHYLSDAESIKGTTSVGMIPGLKSAANLARSTIRSSGAADASGVRITKPKEPLAWMMEEAMREPVKVMVFHDEAAIRADEREHVARAIEREKFKHEQNEVLDRGWRNGWACAIDRATKVAQDPKPKTREQVLEEALRMAPCTCPPGCRHGLSPEMGVHVSGCAFAAARRALEHGRETGAKP